ncbi:hypothetical protein BpHYR1_004895 [Brachionus plicatilis]|uniref:Uncharacterized protein n=1 Tax=Brachionus plicatilis TaxID=10195 RepID=A0A3M7RR51_BRAPC|nr:hypothetical protein BpHYR1_004895 [Brachionus plicatilis]
MVQGSNFYDYQHLILGTLKKSLRMLERILVVLFRPDIAFYILVVVFREYPRQLRMDQSPSYQPSD